MSLKSDLQEIHGIGESKAEEILTLVEESEEYGQTANVGEAIDYIEAGHPEYALKFLKE